MKFDVLGPMEMNKPQRVASENSCVPFMYVVSQQEVEAGSRKKPHQPKKDFDALKLCGPKNT